MSEEQVIKALVGVMSEIGAISKNRKNQQQNYNFRGIDDIYNALQPALIKHGVVVVPSFTEITREERGSKSGGTLIYTTVKGTFKFYHGITFICAIAYGEGMDSGDKSTNKAMSAAFKYALLQTLCIPTEEHIDSETESPQPAPKKQSAPPKPDKPADAATDAQRKALFAKGMARWMDRDRVKAFAEFIMDGAEYLTKQNISEALDNFDSAADLFEQQEMAQ